MRSFLRFISIGALGVMCLMMPASDLYADVQGIEDYTFEQEDRMRFFYDILNGEIEDLAVEETSSALDLDSEIIQNITARGYPEGIFDEFETISEADAVLVEARDMLTYWRERFAAELIWKAQTLPYSQIANDDTDDYEDDWIPILTEIQEFVYEESPHFLDDAEQMLDDLTSIQGEPYLFNKYAFAWWDWNHCKVPGILQPLGIAFGRANTYSAPKDSGDLDKWVTEFQDEFSLKTIFGIMDADVAAASGELERDPEDISNRLDPRYQGNLIRKLATTGVDLTYVGDHANEEAVGTEDAIGDRLSTAAREIHFQSFFRTTGRIVEEVQAYYNMWDKINDELEAVAVYKNRFIFDCP